MVQQSTQNCYDWYAITETPLVLQIESHFNKSQSWIFLPGGTPLPPSPNISIHHE